MSDKSSVLAADFMSLLKPSYPMLLHYTYLQRWYCCIICRLLRLYNVALMALYDYTIANLPN